MKRLLTILILLFVPSVFAQVPLAKNGSMPQGVFKKGYRGQIVQYDANGKKVGIYKIKNGRYVRIK